MPEITYTRIGDYLVPNIALKDPPDAEFLTKYGTMRKHFLKEHKPVTYNGMALSEKLYPHCREVQQQSYIRLDMLMKKLVITNPPPDKITDGLSWAAHMNMLRHTAEEFILTEVIYS